MNNHYQVLIVGGGTAALAVAAHLSQQPKPPQMAILDLALQPHAQSLGLMLGAGVLDRAAATFDSVRLLPPNVTWIKDGAAAYYPPNHQLATIGGNLITYDVLVLAPELQLDWDQIPGLRAAVGQPGTGVHSNAVLTTATESWQSIRQLQSGTVLFAHPDPSLKSFDLAWKMCGIVAAEIERRGLVNQIALHFCTAATTLPQEKHGVHLQTQTELVALDPAAQVATFNRLDSGKTVTMPYDFLHVTPPQRPPKFIQKSPFADDHGFVPVNPKTLTHPNYPAVFACGDCIAPAARIVAPTAARAATVAAIVMQCLRGQNGRDLCRSDSTCPTWVGHGTQVPAVTENVNARKQVPHELWLPDR